MNGKTRKREIHEEIDGMGSPGNMKFMKKWKERKN
jgi:hypothetical protein